MNEMAHTLQVVRDVLHLRDVLRGHVALFLHVLEHPPVGLAGAVRQELVHLAEDLAPGAHLVIGVLDAGDGVAAVRSKMTHVEVVRKIDIVVAYPLCTNKHVGIFLLNFDFFISFKMNTLLNFFPVL